MGNAGRRWAILAIALAALSGSARPAARADEPPSATPPAIDEASFRADLDTAKGILKSGRGGDGLRFLGETLERHRGKDYVRAKRPDLEDLARRLAFRAECPPPDPQSVVKGKLKKFVSQTGDLEIRYEAGKPTDLEDRDGALLFPARFRGPYSIQVRGDEYPSRPEGSPQIQVGMEENPKTGRAQAWAIVSGVPPWEEGNRRVWLPARIVHVDGEEKKTLVEVATSPAKPGRPWRVDVRVTALRISASVDGTSIGSVPKPEKVFGFALIRAQGWREIVVSGQVEPSWIQGKVDAIVEGKRRGFDERFEVRKVLPAWLYERAPAAPTPDPREPRGVPPLAGLAPDLALDYVAATVSLHEGDFRAALAAAQALREKGAPDGLTGTLAAQALLGLEETTKALVEVDRALAADPDAREAFLVRARILLRLGREDELVVALKAATSRADAGAEALETAGLLLLLAGRLEEARTLAEDVARRGRSSPRLETLGRVVVRAQNGPDWPRAHTYETANYRVVSDIDTATARRAANLLEDALVEYRTNVRALKSEEKRRYRVYLFSGQAGFRRYLEDSEVLEGKGPERMAGLYSPVLKQLLIWNLPSRDEMMSTIRHEGFHQYLDRLLPDPPVWFNEGMAVYYETVPRGAADAARLRPDLLGILAGKPLVPVAEFLRIRPKEFYAQAPASYAQAWLLVHLLRHGAPAHREAYRSLLSRLETLSGPEATRATFGETPPASLDTDLRAHLAKLTELVAAARRK